MHAWYHKNIPSLPLPSVLQTFKRVDKGVWIPLQKPQRTAFPVENGTGGRGLTHGLMQGMCTHACYCMHKSTYRQCSIRVCTHTSFFFPACTCWLAYRVQVFFPACMQSSGCGSLIAAPTKLSTHSCMSISHCRAQIRSSRDGPDRTEACNKPDHHHHHHQRCQTLRSAVRERKCWSISQRSCFSGCHRRLSGSPYPGPHPHPLSSSCCCKQGRCRSSSSRGCQWCWCCQSISQWGCFSWCPRSCCRCPVLQRYTSSRTWPRPRCCCSCLWGGTLSSTSTSRYAPAGCWPFG